MRIKTAALLILLCFTTGAHAEPLDDALQAYAVGNHKRAGELLAPLAQAGNPLAQLRLGMLYYLGRSVKEDEHIAADWWKKSAAQGNLDAMFQLGNAYLFGSQLGKTINNPDAEAATWYFRAASAGHAEAQYNLGLMFLVGKGVMEDKVEALYWIKKAAGQDHVDAQRYLKGMETRGK